MRAQNKKTKVKAYQLFLLCVGGLILGCVIPLIAYLEHTGTSNLLLLTMEAVGAGTLFYVFGIYLLKK